MDFDETCIDKIMRYPDLYPKRTSCLNHLLCVNGNGYEWINGELISDYEIEYDVRPRKISRDEALEILYDRSIRETNFYPLCQYAKICNIPYDITESWMLAVMETFRYILLVPENGDVDYQNNINSIRPVINKFISDFPYVRNLLIKERSHNRYRS